MSNYLDKGWFYLVKRKKEKDSIEDIINRYNINLNDYWILKCSNRFRFIDMDEIYNYAGIICFRKDLFKRQDIQRWLDWYNGFDYQIKYLVKPLPPIQYLNKIKIVEWDIK